jgi:signal transduction histidine kinase
MDSATGSRGRKTLASLADIALPAAAALLHGPVPLLVLRVRDLERLAWRAGKRAALGYERRLSRAFLRASKHALRARDLHAHDCGSDIFASVLSVFSRESGAPSALQCRAALARVAAAVAQTGASVESGWTLLRRPEDAYDLTRHVQIALERGRREGERYEFFAAVGHELRTPLTSICGYLETLADGNVDAPTAKRFLDTARREALRMGRLLESMFEFSLLDLSAESIASRSCNLDRSIHAACEIVRPLAAARSIAIATQAHAATARIDPDACLQMLINLLDNAIKHGRHGGTVVIGTRTVPRGVALFVDDDGPGIASAEREAIFRLRVRGSSAAGASGSGIGLAIVKTIVERAGGEIRIGRSPLGGARFETFLSVGAESGAGTS